MCGIAGIWEGRFNSISPILIQKMTESIAHRGPDGFGHWSNQKGLYLGHRRLAIIDLDERSNQPFHYGEKLTISYNGEIYNYIELKAELIDLGFQFRTESGTEVICAAYSNWGINCLDHFDGMFAFALYDSELDQLFCARDRFGEKPFFYAFFEGNIYFASEMKALWEVGVPKVMREQMIYNFLVHDLVEDTTDLSNTFYEHIFKLKASHYFLLKQGEISKQINY